MNQEWIEPAWHKHEGLCYFEAGKNKEWRVTVWEAGKMGFEITIHFRRAYQVFKATPLYGKDETPDQAKERGEKVFNDTKNSIND